MPSTYDLPKTPDIWDSQSTTLYNKLPYHLALMSSRLFPRWHVFNKLFGKRKWEANQGDTLKGVNAEFSPVGRQQFFPNAITAAAPNRDVHQTGERTEDAVVYRHQYETKYIRFNGSFADFRRQQIPHNMADLTQQIAIANDQFIRTMLFHYCPYVLLAGKSTTTTGGYIGDDFVAAPSGIGNIAGTAAKTTAWIQGAIAEIPAGASGALKFNLAKKAQTIATEDLQMPGFEQMQGMPSPNETIKGKLCWVGSNEAFEYFEHDANVLALRSNDKDYTGEDFSGLIGSKGVWKTERFPLRIDAGGEFPAPQIENAVGGTFNLGETIPNPAYVDAPFEVAFCIGGGAYESIDVGAPPKEFGTGRMDARKFSQLRWNGEVRLTSDFLVNYGTAGTPVLETNKYGEFVQLIADTVHGILPVNRRHAFAVIFRRTRVAA